MYIYYIYTIRNNLIFFAPIFFFKCISRRQDGKGDLPVAFQNQFDSIGMEYFLL